MMWILHVTGHADGESYVGPFPDLASAEARRLRDEFADCDTLRAIPLSPPIPYTV